MSNLNDFSEEDWELINKTQDEFYILYSKLVNETLKKVPEKCKHHMRMVISEQSNPYSSDDDL